MPSQSHRSLVLWIARSMSADGFKVAGFDGGVEQGGMFNQLEHPTSIGPVRPDVWALGGAGSVVALGEAKTAGDVCNGHTIRQLRVFGHLRRARSSKCMPLYVAVPRSAALQLDRALALAGLAGAPNIRRLHIPDELLKGKFGVRR
jgi:hypothetical protein